MKTVLYTYMHRSDQHSWKKKNLFNQEYYC